MYFFKTPNIFKKLFPSLVWEMPKKEKNIYLTFDDGPTENLTLWILNELDKYKAKGTFFCVGNNVVNHPEKFARILTSGNTAGNHTFNHLDGWKNSNNKYIQNVELCREFVPSGLFRPPYGHITPNLINKLKRFKIIMWDVLSYDFHKKISKEKCLEVVLQHTEPGSIIVFHDSLKAEEKVMYVLPKVLKHFSDKGFEFKEVR